MTRRGHRSGARLKPLGIPYRELSGAHAAQLRVREAALPPGTWSRPKNHEGPCPGCGSFTCDGYYKPDCDHLLAF